MAKKATTFGGRLIRSAEQAVKISRGEMEPARISRHPLTARRTTVAGPPRYSAARIRRVRKGMGLSQTLVAKALNVSPSTERAWEQGKREPAGPSLRLLELAEREPEVFLGMLEPRPERRTS